MNKLSKYTSFASSFVLLALSLMQAQPMTGNLTRTSSGRLFSNAGTFPDGFHRLPSLGTFSFNQDDSIGNPAPSVSFTGSGNHGSDNYDIGESTADLILQADVMFTNAATAEGFYIAFRTVDSIDFYSAKYGPYYGGILTFSKDFNGNGTKLAPDKYGLPSAENNWYSLEIRAIGNSLQLYFDHTLEFNCTDSSLFSGSTHIGFGTCCSDSNAWFLDNIKAFRSYNITIRNLQPLQVVELYDTSGTLKSVDSVSMGHSSVALDATGLTFPFAGYFKVYSASGTLLFQSSTFTDIWGGDVYGEPLESPLILSIDDVPQDQGGKVTLRWQASSHDTNSAALPFYSIWRALPQGMQPQTKSASVGDISKHFTGQATRFESVGGVTYAWEWIANQPAHRFSWYSYTAQTLFDSMPGFAGWQFFLVSAHTSDVNVFYDSNVDSGHSIDNLPPLPPTNLIANHTPGVDSLRWNPNHESDLKEYVIYRGSTPSDLTIYDHATNAVFTNHEVLPGNTYWAVAAQDIHGNLSALSTPAVETDVSTGDSRVPAVFSLSQNYPNPFNPTSVIRYQLPFQSNVTLVVYDVLGREVRRLVDQVQEAGYKSIGWDATNPDHSPVSSGIYLYRIEATSISDVNNTFVQTRKMILVR